MPSPQPLSDRQKGKSRAEKSADGTIKEAERMRVQTFIAHKELEAIITVFSEYTRNPDVAEDVVEKLMKYAEHRNREVAVFAVGGLVRFGKWSKDAAIEFARRGEWAETEIQEMLRLSGKVIGP